MSRSAFAEPVTAELNESLGFPDLPIIRESRQIIIASPPLLAIAYGNFPIVTLRAQAVRLGMKQSSYHSTELWIAPGKATLSVAEIADSLLLIGARKTLEAAIERYADDTRRYSPLLARGARLAQTNDLWVVATRLPDPLASLFVPLEATARGFEGGVSVRDGLQLEAALESGSEESAAAVAQNIRESIPSMPQVARGLQVVAEADRVLLTLQLDRAHLLAGLRSSDAPAKEQPNPPPQPAAPQGPQVIRIYGLDEGVREIVLPPKHK